MSITGPQFIRGWGTAAGIHINGLMLASVERRVGILCLASEVVGDEANVGDCVGDHRRSSVCPLVCPLVRLSERRSERPLVPPMTRPARAAAMVPCWHELSVPPYATPSVLL